MGRLKLERVALLFLICYIFFLMSLVSYSGKVYNGTGTGTGSGNEHANEHAKDHNNNSDKIEVVSFNNKEPLINEPDPLVKRKVKRPILTAYLQNPEGSSEEMKVHQYPQAYNYLDTQQGQQQNHNNDKGKGKIPIIHPFPIVNDYPDGDSFLPWIHDLHPSADGSSIKLYAQNRRRCHTGVDHFDLMKQLEGQIALFQPIAVTTVTDINANTNANTNTNHYTPRYRVSSYEDANPETKETRFICRFKKITTSNSQNANVQNTSTNINIKTWSTFSTYPFNYEYISWRKRMDTMLEREGKDTAQFWLSALQFDCPMPKELQYMVVRKNKSKQNNDNNDESLYLDIIPIRTPVRYGSKEFFFHKGHGGPINFDVDKEWGRELYIPPIESSTRWENIYIKPISSSWEMKEVASSLTSTSSSLSSTSSLSVPERPLPLVSLTKSDEKKGDKLEEKKKKKPFDLVACTWTSASHKRRGNGSTLHDGKQRLQEWIAFHLLVGYDHIVVYDNSGANTNETTLKDVTDQFEPDLVSYVDWPCKICNNNKPANADPGERSSQYAAEASCRGRFAPYTEWMSFMDPDEYFVPMGRFKSWTEILSNADTQGKKILKFRSTRARPLPNVMKSVYGPEVEKCPTQDVVQKTAKASCLIRSEEYTFLETYNCEYIKSPKPDRFQRAMKQIYRPDYVLSHFVHYSTVTTDLARTKEDTEEGEYKTYMRTSNPQTERFVDEINEGVLIHSKSIVPEEAVLREARCLYKKQPGCNVGVPCSDDLPFNDETHQDGFVDKDGSFCNCWINRKVQDVWLPQLKTKLKELG